jgi:hypothetical protein
VETTGEGLDRAVEAFLAIEALGWKGRRGTAMASRPATVDLARRLFGRASPPVSGRADLLALDGVPIAASLALLCGGTAHLLKAAYDESYRRFGPGVMLEEAILRSLRDTAFAERLDSSSIPGGILEDLFPGRERIGELVIGTCDGMSVEELARAERMEAFYWALRSLDERRRRLARPETYASPPRA